MTSSVGDRDLRLRCERSGNEFLVSLAEQEYCRRNDLPLPILSPVERLREMLTFRSGPYLYYDTCCMTNRRIVSALPPSAGYRVHDPEYAGDINAESYGRPYDFSQPFFWQFVELLRAVPHPARILLPGSNENCEFDHGIHSSVNCYLCFRTLNGVDCLYSHYVRGGTNLIDSLWCIDCELCYECTNVVRCYDVLFSKHCQGCSESAFLFDCIGCKNCFCCTGLRQREFCFENEQLGEAEYRRRVAAHDLGSRRVCEDVERRLESLRGGDKGPSIDACENSSGNYLVSSKNANCCFLSHNLEDVEYVIGAEGLKSSFFVIGQGTRSELIYNCEALGNQAYNVRFSRLCFGSVRDLEYCWNCSSGCTDCFACVGLRRASYCILNKQYSKTEYHELVSRIRAQMKANGEYGRFFPAAMSPTPFNASEGNFFFPLAEDEARRLGYRWGDPDDGVSPTGGNELMPDHVRDVPEDVLARRYRCAATGKTFLVQKHELGFHRERGIAFSDCSPLARINRRAAFFDMSKWCEPSCAHS